MFWRFPTDGFLPDDTTTFLGAYVGQDIHVWRPQAELTLPVQQCTQRYTQQEGTLRVTLVTEIRGDKGIAQMPTFNFQNA